VLIPVRPDVTAVACRRRHSPPPQNAPVTGRPVVVNWLPMSADPWRASQPIERCCAPVRGSVNQRVVVDRSDVPAQAAHQRRIGARRQQDMAGVDHTTLGDDLHATPAGAQAPDGAELADPHPGAPGAARSPSASRPGSTRAEPVRSRGRLGNVGEGSQLGREPFSDHQAAPRHARNGAATPLLCRSFQLVVFQRHGRLSLQV